MTIIIDDRQETQYQNQNIIYNRSLKYILLIYYFIMFLYFLEVKMDGILTFLYIINLFVYMMKRYLKLIVEMRQICQINILLQ